VDGAFTVGSINFNNANKYTITGGGTITLDDSYAASVNVVSGNHEISAPVVIARNTSINVAGGSDLNMSGARQFGNNVTITKTGTGSLRLPLARVAEALAVNTGTVQIPAERNSAATSRDEV
jgi:hypothetical protein